MTREEAIKIFKDHPVGRHWEEDWVDKLAALGVLKLDEPKSAEKEFIDQMQANGIWLTELSVRKALAQANLKIVEK